MLTKGLEAPVTMPNSVNFVLFQARVAQESKIDMHGSAVTFMFLPLHDTFSVLQLISVSADILQTSNQEVASSGFC